MLKWICRDCGEKYREIVDKRPDGPPLCPNGHAMVSDTGGSTSVLETLDNGIMARKVERPRDIISMRHDHAALTEKKDPTII